MIIVYLAEHKKRLRDKKTYLLPWQKLPSFPIWLFTSQRMSLLVSPLRSSSSDSKKGSQSSVKSSSENTGSTSDSVGKSFCLCAAFLGILLEDGWAAECIGNLWETVWVSMWTWFTGWLSVSFGAAGSSERSKHHIFIREHTDDVGVHVQSMSENYGILSKKSLDRSKICYSTFNIGFCWKLMKLNQKNNRLNWSAIISLLNPWWPIWWKKINDNMASSLSISMTQENTTHLQIGRGMGLVQDVGGGGGAWNLRHCLFYSGSA